MVKEGTMELPQALNSRAGPMATIEGRHAFRGLQLVISRRHTGGQQRWMAGLRNNSAYLPAGPPSVSRTEDIQPGLLPNGTQVTVVIQSKAVT